MNKCAVILITIVVVAIICIFFINNCGCMNNYSDKFVDNFKNYPKSYGDLMNTMYYYNIEGDEVANWFKNQDYFRKNNKHFFGYNPAYKPGMSRYLRMNIDKKTPFNKYSNATPPYSYINDPTNFKFLDGAGYEFIYPPYFINRRIWNRPYQMYDYYRNFNDDQILSRIYCGKRWNHKTQPELYNNCVFTQRMW